MCKAGFAGDDAPVVSLLLIYSDIHHV